MNLAHPNKWYLDKIYKCKPNITLQELFNYVYADTSLTWFDT